MTSRGRGISELPQEDLKGRLLEFAKTCPAFAAVANSEGPSDEIIAQMHSHLKTILGEEKFNEITSGETHGPESTPQTVRDKYIAFAKLCPAFAEVSSTNQSTIGITKEMHQYLAKLE